MWCQSMVVSVRCDAKSRCVGEDASHDLTLTAGGTTSVTSPRTTRPAGDSRRVKALLEIHTPLPDDCNCFVYGFQYRVPVRPEDWWNIDIANFIHPLQRLVIYVLYLHICHSRETESAGPCNWWISRGGECVREACSDACTACSEQQLVDFTMV